jgi:hypothetical protein
VGDTIVIKAVSKDEIDAAEQAKFDPAVGSRRWDCSPR